MERRPSPGDKRALHVFPTQKAKDALPQIEDMILRWQCFVAQDLSEEERRCLTSMLAKMKDRSGEWMDKR